MGLRSGLPNLGPPRRCVADLAAPIQLAPAAQQSKSKSAHQPPRSDRGQPVEAPQSLPVSRIGTSEPNSLFLARLAAYYRDKSIQVIARLRRSAAALAYAG